MGGWLLKSLPRIWDPLACRPKLEVQRHCYNLVTLGWVEMDKPQDLTRLTHSLCLLECAFACEMCPASLTLQRHKMPVGCIHPIICECDVYISIHVNLRTNSMQENVMGVLWWIFSRVPRHIKIPGGGRTGTDRTTSLISCLGHPPPLADNPVQSVHDPFIPPTQVIGHAFSHLLKYNLCSLNEPFQLCGQNHRKERREMKKFWIF